MCFERNCRLPRYFPRWFTPTLSRSSLKVNVIRQSSRLQHDKCSFSARDARYEVTHTCIARGRDQTCTRHFRNALVVCRVRCAKVVGTTSSEGLLVYTERRKRLLTQACIHTRGKLPTYAVWHYGTKRSCRHNYAECWKTLIYRFVWKMRKMHLIFKTRLFCQVV